MDASHHVNLNQFSVGYTLFIIFQHKLESAIRFSLLVHKYKKESLLQIKQTPTCPFQALSQLFENSILFPKHTVQHNEIIKTRTIMEIKFS